VLGNRDRSTNALNAVSLAAGATETSVHATTLEWPEGVYSLSHIAIPFRFDDIVYGNGNTNDRGNFELKLGALAPRGEAGVLMLTSDFFLRTRNNPFYTFQAKTLTDWIDTLE
jgi:hypothetical protein